MTDETTNNGKAQLLLEVDYHVSIAEEISTLTTLQISLVLKDKMNFTLWNSPDLPDDIEQYKNYLDDAVNMLSLISGATKLPFAIDDNVFLYMENLEEDVRNYVTKLTVEI